jgi:hypothetical protein
LGDLADIASGWSSKRGEQAQVIRSVLLPRDVLPIGVVSIDALQQLSVPAAAERCSIQPGDVVLVSRGSAGAFRAGVVYGVPPDTIVTSNLLRVRLKANGLLGEVLVAFLLTAEAQAALKARSQGSATFSITLGQLSELLVPVPPMPVQQTLAALWRATQRAYDSGIEAARARRELGLGVIERHLTTGWITTTLASEQHHGR